VRGLTQPVVYWIAATIVTGCSSEPVQDSSQPETDGEAGTAAETGTDGFADSGSGSGNVPDGDGVVTDCSPALAELEELPLLLSETGLYAEPATKTVNAFAREFAPQFPLWTDGAAKRRWIYLPGCETIDTADMDFWSFPVGTRAWKEFVVASPTGDLLLETRIIIRTGPGEDDFLFGSYRWNDAEVDAALLIDGESDVRGTNHDIPDEQQCLECHGGGGDGWGGGGGGGWGDRDGGGTPSRFLGFGAIQLSHDGPGLQLQDLIDEQRLTASPSGHFSVPDGMSGTAARVLGNFHGNCGHCHNTSPDGLSDVDMDLFLSVEATTVEASGAYQTTVNVRSEDWQGGDRIAPGDPQGSEVFVRDADRGTGFSSDQMPPLGTEVADDAALADLEAWICALGPC